jgi:hypothetical protein
VALRQRIAQLDAIAVAPRQTAAEVKQGQARASRGLQEIHIINAFNNVLTVMLGDAELTLRSVPQRGVELVATATQSWKTGEGSDSGTLRVESSC